MNTTQLDPQLTFVRVIDDFLNLLLDEGGMDTVSVEVRAQMLRDLRVRLNERFFTTVITNLSDEKISQFRELSESKVPGEGLEKFIDQNIPNAKEIFAQVMITFRNNYLGIA